MFPNKTRIALVVFFLTLHIYGYSQYYSSGEAPASVQWEQIKTDRFTLVFPSTFAGSAKTLAAVIDSSFRYNTVSMGRMPGKTKILVHAQSAYSNGFMTWAPKRMELYPTPPQAGNTNDWLCHLALHEQRHLVQMDQMNKGFSRWMTYAFGQQATGAMIGLHLPLWFMEGDAVMAETLLTESGRGRTPDFWIPLKAQILEKRIYSYNKAYLGSYRDYVPNYYVMGYHLVTGARQWHNPDMWKNATAAIGANGWYPFQFNRQVKRQTGMNKRHLYHSVFDSLRTIWTADDKTLQTSSYKPITQQNHKYKNYLYPQPSGHGTLVAEVTGPGETTRFVEIANDGSERTLDVAGNRNEEPFSIKAGRMVWSEQKDHLRWSNAAASVIKMYDFGTQRTTYVGPRDQKLFSPSLSPDGKMVAAVRVNKDNSADVVILDIPSNTIAYTHTFEQALPVSPIWSSNGNELAVILQNHQGKQLVVYSIDHQTVTPLYGPTHDDIRHPCWSNNKIVFAHVKNGRENIYGTNPTSPAIKQLTQERFGAVAPYIDNDSLVYSRYTADGYQLAKTSLSEPIEMAAPAFYLAHDLEKREAGKPDFAKLDTSGYRIAPYSKWHLFNPHSWAPAFVNVSDQTISRGISVMSQNLLNTLFVEAGYNADRNYQTEKYSAKIVYKGWYPQLHLTVKAGDSQLSSFTSTTASYMPLAKGQNHYQLLPGFDIPFNLSRGPWVRHVSPSARYIYYKETGYLYERTTLNGQTPSAGLVQTYAVPDFESHGLEYDLFAYQLKRGAQRDIATRRGMVLEANYRHTPWGDHSRGSQLAMLSRLYFPGLGKHHAIKLENNYQIRTDGEIYDQNDVYYLTRRFQSVVQMPRGYLTSGAQTLYSLRADYQMPLLYPDWSMGGIMYVKRLSASLFFDYSHAQYRRQLVSNGQYNTIGADYRSLGTDLLADIHPARFILPVTMGIRIAYLPNEKRFFNELLINLNLGNYLATNRRSM